MLDQLESQTASQVGWRNCPETLRLALAAVYTSGPGFRRKLIRKATNPIAAPPFEVGLDPRPAVYLACKLEEDETRFRSICAGLVASAILAYFADAPPFSLALILLITAVVCGFHHSRLTALQQRFSKGKFKISVADQLLDQAHAEQLDFGVSGPDQNVIVYKDFDPFKPLGTPTGKWSFTVDIGRAAHRPEGKAAIVPIELSEIEATIKDQIVKSAFGEITTREVITVRGEDAPILPMISRFPSGEIPLFTSGEWPPPQQPRVDLSEQEAAQICSQHPNLARRYLLFHDIRWNGELILTHAVRAQVQGRMFYIETSRFVLTPPSQAFKAIDRTTFRERFVFLNTRWDAFLGFVIASPLVAVIEAYRLLATISLWRSSKNTTKAYKESLEKDPIYNYGAGESTRREMMEPKFDHFSQKADLDFAEKAFDQTVVEVIFGYMENHGVDVSDLRNKVMTIYNSGIMVQGGDVTAQAMAVGQGASAQTSTKNPLNTKANAA